jgi:hypothetical protein
MLLLLRKGVGHVMLQLLLMAIGSVVVTRTAPVPGCRRCKDIRSTICAMMWFLDITWFLKLVVKGGRIALENGVPSGFNRIRVQGGIVTSDALALWSTRRGGRKTLAVQLQTTVNVNRKRGRVSGT